MKTYAVCELQKHLDEIIRLVREEGEVVEITQDGEIIADILPVRRGHKPDWLVPPEGDPWENMKRLSAEISAHWPEGVSAVDAVRDARGDL